MIFIDCTVSRQFYYYRSQSDYGFGEPAISKDELVLTQSLDVKTEYELRGYNVSLLSSYLNLPDFLGLYEIFSIYFDGKISSDFDMLRGIFTGLIQDSDYCFCLNVGNTFCWFIVGTNSLRKLGKIQFSHDISKYSIGKFIKRLRYQIVDSGINLNKVRYLYWDSNDLSKYLVSYIKDYSYLSDFFNKIDGLKNLSIISIMQLLSENHRDRYISTASDFIDCLNDSFVKLGLNQKDGILYARHVFYKDYSSCKSNIFNKKGCTYGLILDCEGKKSGVLNDGVSEIGGLIFCKYKNILLNIEMFISDEPSLWDTFNQIIKSYKEITGELFSRNKIKVFVYGKSDSIMLNSSLKKVCSLKNYKLITSTFSLVDSQSFINHYLDKNNIVIEKSHSLSNIAMAMDVQVVKPLHNPINDSRTLFNILAKILQSSNILDSVL